ncbi:hypothetical protein E2562_027571 [Oryza meyeriana var. granulata]|uniref:Uncharacterized protein n=1 Tax=Oryza meyeriana var. granulata TaxID=110450 RepID=A0A6G1DMT3_9ORYZ|nr:hypothetical protein E2562_027571 [Oryza meyeriana var. granulata]
MEDWLGEKDMGTTAVWQPAVWRRAAAARAAAELEFDDAARCGSIPQERAAPGRAAPERPASGKASGRAGVEGWCSVEGGACDVESLVTARDCRIG